MRELLIFPHLIIVLPTSRNGEVGVNESNERAVDEDEAEIQIQNQYQYQLPNLFDETNRLSRDN